MGTFVCPRCQQRYVQPAHTGDYVHECHSGNLTLDQEDVLVIGDWEDYTGSAEVPNAPRVQGIAPKNWGRRSWIEGQRTKTATRRGNNAETTRARKHLEYIPAEDD